MKTTEQKAPALRFPEFEGEWEMKRLGSIATFLTGYSFKGDDISENPQGVKLMRGANISEGYIEHSPNIDRYYLGDLETLGKYLVKTNDIVIGMDGSKVGKNVAIVDQIDNNSLLVQRVCRIRCVKEKSVLNFIYQPLISEPFIQYVDKVKTSSGIPHISLDHIKSYSIHFPSLPEQQKIADFLSATDKRLELLKEKKQELEDYKRGAMQHIFSQELRFTRADDSVYEDWEEKKLGEIANIYDGTHQTPKYVDDGIPFYSVEHLTANNYKQTKFVTYEAFVQDNKRAKIEKGDILMTRIGDIGTAKLVDWEYDSSYYVSLALIKINNKDYDSSYISHFIRSVFFQMELWKRTIHVAFPKKINLGEINFCEVKLPCLEEQTQIANFLSAIDSKIEKLNEQIEAMESYKKGLLQQMFV